jgi:hypothetical protein
MLGPGRLQRAKMLHWLGGGTPTGQLSATPYAAFSTATIADDGTGIAEPSGTGSYAAEQINWTTPPTPTAGQPAVLANSNTITWGPSSAAWSTGATTLPVIGVYDHLTTRSEAVFAGAMAVAVPRAVNAAGVELESVPGDLQFTLTPT